MMTEENYYYSLLKYLSFGVLYDIYCEYEGNTYILEAVNRYNEVQLVGKNFTVPFYDVKPYLRPMSSMTEEEFEKLKEYSGLVYDQLDLASFQDGAYKCLDFYLNEVPANVVILVFDWLNAHHFDYRGLIERGLAIEVTEENNLYKN